MSANAGEQETLNDYARVGNEKAVTRMLSYPDDHLDVNFICRNGMSALHEAVTFDQLAVAKILLAHGASVDLAVPSTGYTALRIATNLRKTKIVAALLEAGADPNKTSNDGTKPSAYNEEIAALFKTATERLERKNAARSSLGEACTVVIKQGQAKGTTFFVEGEKVDLASNTDQKGNPVLPDELASRFKK